MSGTPMPQTTSIPSHQPTSSISSSQAPPLPQTQQQPQGLSFCLFILLGALVTGNSVGIYIYSLLFFVCLYFSKISLYLHIIVTDYGSSLALCKSLSCFTGYKNGKRMGDSRLAILRIVALSYCSYSFSLPLHRLFVKK